MAKAIGRVAGAIGLLAVLAMVVAGAMMLVSSPSSAARQGGGPLCGYSTPWDCTMPNGSHRLVGGTRCDIAKFQQQTGATCVPAGL